MEKLRNLSVKKTIVLYLAVSLTAGFLLSGLVVYTAEHTQLQIWWKYVDEQAYLEALEGEEENYQVSIPRPYREIMSRWDNWISEVCDFLITYTVLIVSIGASCLSMILFYRNKLRLPLKELGEASRMIGENELDFHISYENRDELGQLCREFEWMRSQLEENHRRLWRMVEDEKALRAAIAHDIRSPLAVLRGYQEMLLEFVPQGLLDQDKIVEMLKEGMGQIERMEEFIGSMRQISRLEDRRLWYRTISGKLLGESMRRTGEILSRKAKKTCLVTVENGEASFEADSEMILEVAENLLSNALQYADRRVEVRLSLAEETLTLLVTDDGCGFSQDTETVTRPFCRGSTRDSLQHFGMGMYISRIYCEKHGGGLWAENRTGGGAAAKAVFRVRAVPGKQKE